MNNKWIGLLNRFSDFFQQLISRKDTHRRDIENQHTARDAALATYAEECRQLTVTLEQFGMHATVRISFTNQRITDYDDHTPQYNRQYHRINQQYVSTISTYLSSDVYEQTINKYISDIELIQQETALVREMNTIMPSMLSDTVFRQSLYLLLDRTLQFDESMNVMRILHSLLHQHDADIPLSDPMACPHPAVLNWVISRYYDKHRDLSLLAWAYPPLEHAKQSQYEQLLDYIVDKLQIHDIKQDAHIQTASWQLLQGISYITQTAQVPSPLIADERRRKRHKDRLSLDNFTFSYVYMPNEYSLNRGLLGEDVLLFDMHEENFFVVVCDGVSQSCLGDRAARNVAQSLHHAWQLVLHKVHDISNLDNLMRQAFEVAKHQSNYDVYKFLADPPAHYTNTTINILRKRHEEGGSQTIFACAFSINGIVYTISMGNTAIIMQGDVQGFILNYDNPQFQDDSIRFSSRAIHGLRGEYIMHKHESFLSNNSAWRIVIHSDALEEYPDREETLYTAPLERPNGRPLNADDVKLEQCVRIDDTTIVELFYARPSS